MKADDDVRPAQRDPEALLRQVEAAERAAGRGQLKIFLGYASGVGKSFRLVDEGRRRRQRGEDVVVAATQPGSTPDVEAVIAVMESIPTQNVGGVPVIDVPAVLARRPQVAVVDGLAYDNPAGSRHQHRYEDVDELLESGISVMTSINLEYISEQQEFVRSVLKPSSGKPFRRPSSIAPTKSSSSMPAEAEAESMHTPGRSSGSVRSS